MSASRIGHYTIVSELGRGGMGVVYKAHEESLNRFVAIKVLSDQLSQDPTFIARFVREAQAAAGLSHPNIIQIFYIGEDNGRHYFVMEYVSGKSLLTMVREEGRIGNPRAAQYMLQAANGLATAHDKGFLHRDIKPANLMVNEQGLLKIADFGLALPQDATTKLTATGMLMGTPGYLSPEQCRGEGLDRRTDIYSLGVTYYELLSGRMPFQADSPLALLHKILQEEPPDITSLSESVDPETRRIVNKMIAKDRDKRYQDCRELAADLEKRLGAEGVRVTTVGVAGMRAASEPDISSQPTRLLSQSGSVAAPSAPLPPAVSAPIPPEAAAAPAVATPPSPVTTPAQVAAASAMVPAPQALPVPATAPQARKSKAPLVAVAVVAVLFVAMVASAFFVLRSPLVKRYLPWLHTSQSAQQAETTAPAAESGSTAGDASSGQAQSAAPQPKTAAQSPAESGSGTAGAAGAGAAGVAATSAEGTAGGRAAATGHRGRSRSAAAGSAADATGTGSGPATGDSGTSEGAEPRRQAGELAGVAVAVVGEEPLAGTVSSLLQSELQAAGLQVLDASTLPGSEDLLRNHGEPSANQLIRALKGDRAAVLVLARVQRVGERMLSYMDRQDVAYSSRVVLTSYDVATGQPRGQSRSVTVEYTQLNLEQSAEKTLGPVAREVAEEVR